MKRIDEIRRTTPASDPPRPRREYPTSFPNDSSSDEPFTRRPRRIRRGLIPQSRTGRIAAGIGTALVLGTLAAASLYTARFFHHDPHFTIPSSAAIELEGNHHLSRSQLLSIFGEDVDQNIFDIPLRDRRDALEQMPWVEHATVMRLLPNRLRVHVTERTPIAFVRQGGSIGMADSNGVLLDIPPDAPGDPNYSFPVVTGLKSDDTPQSREQRMHLYSAFLRDLDSDGKKISSELSEVDLSDPEDIKALLPSGGAATATETLVHFGTDNFLARYKRFEEHIAEWRSQYPRLSGVDMRYERQVVLQMPPKDSTIASSSESSAIPKPNEQPPAKLELKTKQPVAVKITPAKPLVTAHTPDRPSPATIATTRPAAKPNLTERDLPSPSATANAAIRPPVHHAEAAPAKHLTTREGARSADVAKRIEATKSWMVRRQQTRKPPPQHQ